MYTHCLTQLKDIHHLVLLRQLLPGGPSWILQPNTIFLRQSVVPHSLPEWFSYLLYTDLHSWPVVQAVQGVPPQTRCVNQTSSMDNKGRETLSVPKCCSAPQAACYLTTVVCLSPEGRSTGICLNGQVFKVRRHSLCVCCPSHLSAEFPLFRRCRLVSSCFDIQ